MYACMAANPWNPVLQPGCWKANANARHVNDAVSGEPSEQKCAVCSGSDAQTHMLRLHCGETHLSSLMELVSCSWLVCKLCLDWQQLSRSQDLFLGVFSWHTHDTSAMTNDFSCLGFPYSMSG